MSANPYAEIIAKAQQAAAERRRAGEEVEARRKAEQQRVDAAGRAFLEGTILTELEKAREALEAAGTAAEIGNGQTGGKVCRTLTVRVSPPRILTFEAVAGHAEPWIRFNDGRVSGAKLQLIPEAVQQCIGKFLISCWNG